MRKISFQLKKARIRGRIYYVITEPNPEGGRPKRRFFDKKSDAETHLEKIKVQRDNYGASAFSISDSLRIDATIASEILSDSGASLADAARYYAAHHKLKKSGISITDAVAAFLASREISNEIHKRTLKSRLELFAASAVDHSTSTITPEDIVKFIRNLPHAPRTKQHYWVHLNALFDYCVIKKWSPENPMPHVSRPTVTSGEVVILTPVQARTLLKACDKSILPGVAIAMFCGLRQAEIEKLDWSAVYITEGHIRLAAAQVKTRARRIVPIPDCAKSWLKRHCKKKGAVWPQGNQTRDIWTQARIIAGFGPFKPTSSKVRKMQTDQKSGKPRKDLIPWPANALRHSAISYKLAEDPNLAKLAYESGNSPEIIREHYNGVATAAASKEFFSITPDASRKPLKKV